ncbi:spirocyclase AveC family protein [Amycolatopsis sp. NPDC089917]|uniref:spirocyclase AveC family protein n=1 Tax=Amycolatopsis sp. NPDC089917 TaxID=3155187 RepID=UPI0034454908
MAWAALGTVLLLAEVYTLSRWIGTDAEWWLPQGDYGLEPTQKTMLTTFHVLSITGTVACVLWPIHQSIRRRTLTIETMVLIGYLSAGWLIPVFTYSGPAIAYSKYLIGTTGWGQHLPGWHGPDPTTHPVPLFVGWFALAEVMMWTLPTVWALRAAVRRWPRLTGTKLILFSFLPALAAELVLETVMVFSGAYVYPSAPPALTLFAGHWYQIPIPVAFAAAVAYGVIPGLLCHHPESHPLLRSTERLPDRARRPIQLMAVIGLSQITFLGLCTAGSVIASLYGVHATDLPPHLQ